MEKVEKKIDNKHIEKATSGNVVGFTPDAGCGNEPKFPKNKPIAPRPTTTEHAGPCPAPLDINPA